MSVSKDIRIAIIGGGIGGMTLALSLHDAGFTNVDVYESDSVISTLGVGINVLVSAVLQYGGVSSFFSLMRLEN
jgi:2-polyprenyl-6-methoxyphenol hydroxylase-like FAD-dependent oxidoreductase